MATISTHNGSKFSQAHNRRDTKITSKEAHIDPKGVHEEWLDVDIKEAYNFFFDDSVKEYNSKQTRKDRKIKNYYEKVKNDKKKNVAYEMIVGVYDKNLDDDTKRDILLKYVQTWEDRNPNLKLFGVYFHNDEEGQAHVHIDYLPMAYFDKGLEYRNSLTKALEQQGIESGTSIHETCQILWEQKENKALEEICNSHNINIEHGTSKNRQHENISKFKERKIKEDIKKLEEGYKTQKELILKQQETINKHEEYIQELEKIINDNEIVINKQIELHKKLVRDNGFEI